MKITDIKSLRKEVEQEYIRKGYSDEKLEDALMNDPRYPKDRLIEVTGYDLENNKILGLLDSKKCEVTMCPSAFARGEELVAQNDAEGKMQTPAKWLGHKIDENMAQSLAVNSQVILQESVIEENKDVMSIVTSRIIGVAPKSENTFAGIFSMKPKEVENQKITKVQHWQPLVGGQLSATIEKMRNSDNNPGSDNKPKNK